MILILGGTIEGRIAVRTLEKAGKLYYYCTKEDEPKITMRHGIHLKGVMDEVELKRFCYKYNIKMLIDATHPFAEQMHQAVSNVTEKLRINAIRFERFYPPRDKENITWCRDYQDAIYQIRRQEIFSLLALTGVQSIDKLKPLWQESTCCYFRILDRDSSRHLAARAGFSKKNLYYYHKGEDERLLMHQLHPEAILIKESGSSGGFSQKVEAALQEGIRIFAICRPPLPLPNSYLFVNGELSLRRKVEDCLPDFYPIHSGLTTGTCAAAAAVAATFDLLSEQPWQRPNAFCLILPNGETIFVPVVNKTDLLHSDSLSYNRIMGTNASVIKDAGDTPDITNGMEICANVAVPFYMGATLPKDTSIDNYKVIVRGGEGVGIVTQSELGIGVGSPAINDVSRKMIEDNVKYYLNSLRAPCLPKPYIVTISIPDGKEIAKRTPTPLLGVEGGLPIMDTTGMVKPSSSDTFVDSIRKSLEAALATGSPRIVISSNAQSERYMWAYYPELPQQAFVHYSNSINETIKLAALLKIPKLTLGIMMDNAVKLAYGSLNTRNYYFSLNKMFLEDVALAAGCSANAAAVIQQINLAHELCARLSATDLQAFCRRLLQLCHHHCDQLLPHGELTILFISEDGKIIS